MIKIINSIETVKNKNQVTVINPYCLVLARKGFPRTAVFDTVLSAFWDIEGNHVTMNVENCGVLNIITSFSGFKTPQKVFSTILKKGNLSVHGEDLY